jgi:hypothetical protein
LEAQPRLSIITLAQAVEPSLKAVLSELESPINDGIDVNQIYSKVKKTKGHGEIRKKVLRSLQIAINKSKPVPDPIPEPKTYRDK